MKEQRDEKGANEVEYEAVGGLEAEDACGDTEKESCDGVKG